MTLFDRISKAAQEFSYTTKKLFRSFALPAALATSGMGIASCQPPRRGNAGGGGYSDGSDDFSGDSRPNLEMIIPPTTKVLGGTGKLVSMSDDYRKLEFMNDSTYAQDLSKDDVMVAGIHDRIPHGFLRKVVSVRDVDGRIQVETKPASLEDAIEQGTLSGHLEFSQDYLERRDTLRRGLSIETQSQALRADLQHSGKIHVDFDKVEPFQWTELDGSLDVTFTADFKIEISYFKVRYMLFKLGATEEAHIQLVSSYSGAASKEYDLNLLRLPAFQFTFGGFPLVFVPRLTATNGASANGNVTLELELNQELRGELGIEYDREREDRWSPIAGLYPDFSVGKTTMEGEMRIEAHTTPKISLLLYDAAGIYAGIKALFRANIHTPDDAAPRITLEGLLQIGGGAEVSIFGKSLLDSGLIPIYEYQKVLFKRPVEGCTSDAYRTCSTMYGGGAMSIWDSCDNFEAVIHACESERCNPETNQCVPAEGDCTPNSYRRCEDGNLSQYNSCDQLERVIECANGCERGARRCNDAQVGEGEGEGQERDWTLIRRMVLPQGYQDDESLAWDGSLLWVWFGSPQYLCSLNTTTGEFERCFEDVDTFGEDRVSIAYARENLYFLEFDMSRQERNELSMFNPENGNKTFLWDFGPHHRWHLGSLISYNGTLSGLHGTDRGSQLCTIELNPVRTECSETRPSPTNIDKLVKIADDEYVVYNSLSLSMMRGDYATAQIENRFEVIRGDGKCGDIMGWISLTYGDGSLFVGCGNGIILEYRND